MKSIEKFIAWLEGEVGYLEKKSNAQLDDKTANAGSANYTKYARDLDKLNYYNGKKNGYSWCCVFPDAGRTACFGMDTALKMVGQKQGGLGAGVKYVAQYYQAIGRLFSSPQRGDQMILVSRNSKGDVTTWLHTGIVKEVKNGRVYTIEGNTSPASGVVSNGGGVYEKSYQLDSKSIYGYGRPLWELAEKEMEKEAQEMTEKEVQQIVDKAIEKLKEELKPKTYNTIAQVPDWAVPTINTLINKGKLKGDESGNLNLSEDLMRALVIMNR